MKKVLVSLVMSIFVGLCVVPSVTLALSIDSATIWRDNIIHETGAFTGVLDRDKISISAQLSGVPDPDDYLVHVTSGNPAFVDIYLSSYRNRGGGAYEFVDLSPLPAPGPAWENDTYHFDLVDKATLLTVYDSDNWTIPAGYVTNPLDIPDWYAFSGDVLHPTVEWGATPDAERYQLRVYELNPNGSFNYQAITYSTPRFAATTWNLDGFTMEYGKSYAVGIQSLIIHPDDNGVINRSQYYVRYDTAPVPEPATMLLLGSGIVGLAGFRRKFKKS